MATRHFTQDRVEEIRASLLEVLGYDPMTRSALLAGLPVGLRGLLSGGLAPPAIGLTLDLEQLNAIERLVDGSVPLKRFLGNAIGLATDVEAMDTVRSALADIEAETTGAEPVTAAHLHELGETIIVRDDMVPFGFLRGGIAAAAAVAKLVVPCHDNGVPRQANGKPVNFLGTGWLIAPGLLMTNHHVINARTKGEPAAGVADLRRQAQDMTVLFDYDDIDLDGTPAAPTDLVSWDPALDYALVRIEHSGRAALPLAAAAVTDVTPHSAVPVNIIQHPDGRPKFFGIRNNLVTSATPTDVRYFTDTLGGSSGSPVLNDRWEVVALHRGTAFVSGVKYLGKTVAYVNVGTQITAVLQHLRNTHGGELAELGI